MNLGSNVATDNSRILTAAYKQAIAELPKDQEFRSYSIITYNKRWRIYNRSKR